MSDLIDTIQSNIRFILSFIIISNFIIIFLLKFSLKIKTKFESFFNNGHGIENKEKYVLLIIAHPDDEVMFFSPLIKFLLHTKTKIKILCLSNGNYDKIGKIREEEFQNLCKNLRIEDYKIIDDWRLQDNIKQKWDKEVVSEKIDEYFNSEDNMEKIGSIVTFDERGVTHHPNHISCSEGLM